MGEGWVGEYLWVSPMPFWSWGCTRSGGGYVKGGEYDHGWERDIGPEILRDMVGKWAVPILLECIHCFIEFSENIYGKLNY